MDHLGAPRALRFASEAFDIVAIDFAGNQGTTIASGESFVIDTAAPAPSRTIALVWRSSSALSSFLRELAECLRALPPELLKP